MKPYDKSNSFMRRVTKRVSNLLPSTTWMNMLLGESQSDDDPTLTSDNDHQPPVKKLCTPNNTFTNTNNRTCEDNNPSIILTENSRNTRVRFLLPEISAVTCIPSTSKQSPKFINQTNSSLEGPDIGNKSSLKRKSDVTDLSNISRQSPKTLAFNFASSTPTLISANKQSVDSTNLKSSLILDKSSTKNEFSTPVSTKLMKPRERESQSMLKLHETSGNVSSPSFRWDTFVHYGELSERQKLFAQKSPLNCSQVMYGGNSARSTLSKILGHTPPIHRKAVIPISPTSSSGVRSTSSILLEHTSTKDKEIEENTFIIQPRGLLRHKAEQKTIPIKIETTVKIVDKTPEKTDDKSNNNSLICSGRDTSRKLRANISKKARGCKSEELEMPAKVDLPNISLSVPVLPSIKLSNNDADVNEFTFNQPLTIEQFSLQIAEKTCRKKQKMTLKKLHNTSSKDALSPLSNVSAHKTSKIESEKVSISNNKISVEDSTKNNKGPELCKFGDISKDTPISDSKLENTKPINTVFNSSQEFESTNKNKLPLEKSVEIKKWTCDTCWVSNDIDKINCVACQTPKTDNSQQPLKVSKSSTWTCETCWVPNKNEIDMCVACQTQKPGTTKKVVEQCSTWTCDACWVKNKSECACCISCGTAKQGSAPENKLSTSTQFKFGLVNNTVEKSTISQFKFGFDSKNNDQSFSQFKFGSPATFNTFENGKSDSSTTEFKFGMVNNKTDQSLGTFKFGIDSTVSQSEKKPIELSHINNTDNPSSQFKFGFESKSEPHESQFKFGQTSNTSKPAPQYKFGSDNVETEKSAKQNLNTDSNKVAQSKNEMKLINHKNEVLDKSINVQNKSIQFKFGDNKQFEKSTPQLTFGSAIVANCSTANTFVNFGKKNEDLSSGKFVWDKKDKTEIKPIIFGKSQSLQSSKGSTNTNQLVNGHSHSNDMSKGQKPGLIKTSQLFNFGSLAKQDQNLPDDQKKTTTLTFGSANNDNKPFVTPTLTSSSFPSMAPVFGTSDSMFGNGPTTPVTLGSSALTPQFSFASMAPQTSNFSFSKTSKDNDNKPLDQSSNSLTSTTNVGFSFGTQSPPVFGIANAGGFIKPIQNDDQFKNTSNNIFGQSSTKQTVKLDPNAPISINFTGGATTQFTAKPETTEQPAKRKILKPVRRIR